MKTLEFIESEIRKLQDDYFKTNDVVERSYINGKLYELNQIYNKLREEIN